MIVFTKDKIIGLFGIKGVYANRRRDDIIGDNTVFAGRAVFMRIYMYPRAGIISRYLVNDRVCLLYTSDAADE